MMASDEQTPMGEPTTLSDEETSVTEIEIQDMDERLIKGWASVNVKDVQGDNIPIEVMKKAFLRYMMIVGGLLMFKHSNHPIGKIVWWGVKYNPEAGKYGIQVIAQLHSGYRLHDIVWEGVKQKIIKGFSLGAFVPDPEINTIIKDGQRIPTLVEMDELSPVFSPANPYATLDEFAEMAKSADDKDMLQFLDELKKAIEGCCGNSGTCEKKCGRCKSMESNKAQEPSPDIKRLEEMYGNTNSKALIEILSAEDLMLISPPLEPEKGLSAGMSLGDIAAKHGIAMTDLEEELHLGIEKEMEEHADDPEGAKAIAMDHLTEDPKYYTKLTKMEEEEKENINDIGEQQIQTKTLENTLATMTKKKVYVGDPSKVPQGVTVQTGSKGGQYYESTQAEKKPEGKKIKIGKQPPTEEAVTAATAHKPEEGVFPGGGGQKPRKGEAIRVPSAGGKGKTGDRSVNRSWWEQMQEKKKALENLEQDPDTPIHLVESIDMLITFNDDKANNPAIRQDLAKLQQVMDVDEDAKEMARDLLYFLDEKAEMDAKALWNRFKVLYGPGTDPGTLSNEQYGEMKTMRKAMEMKKSVEELELNLMAKELKKSVDNLDRSIPSS